MTAGDGLRSRKQAAAGRWRTALLALCAIAALAASLAAATLAGADAGAAPAGAAATRAGTPDAADASRRPLHRCQARDVDALHGVVRRISIRCQLRDRAQARLVNAAPARIVRRPEGGNILGVNRHRNLVRYRAGAGFGGIDSFVVMRRVGGVRWRAVVRVDVPEPPPAPPAPHTTPAPRVPIACEATSRRTNYETPVRLEVTCTGSGLAPLAVAAAPSHGALEEVRRGGDGSARTLSATYVPADLFVGEDALRVEAREPGGRVEATASVEVRPWRMRALGDSATAGFGFLGNGTEITSEVLLACSPPATFNNDRCSSNSDNGPGYEGPTSYSADFGLANDVSWAAQFANDWQGGGHITAPLMFQNRAVTGSTPAEWLPGGPLHARLEAIVAEDPDLIAFTLGVNPLLNRILIKGEQSVCIKEAATVAAVNACIEPLFREEAVQQRLEAIYTALLAAPGAEVVTFQYHNAYPYLAILHELVPWQVEALIAHLNAEIAAAVGSVKAAQPASGVRLTLVEAQVDPTKPDPLKVARFDVGVPANPNQPFTPTFACDEGFTVDGPSHQSNLTQEQLPPLPFVDEKFCPGPAWTINADTGIHPNRAGYAQFAAALLNVAAVRGLVPLLP